MYIGLQFSFVNEEKDCPCFFEDSAFRFFTLILTDLVVLVWKVLSQSLGTQYYRVSSSQHQSSSCKYYFDFLGLMYSLERVNCLRGKGGDEAAKPEFDVATEYLELFYRQFVIYIGMMVFPGVTVLGLFANIIEVDDSIGSPYW